MGKYRKQIVIIVLALIVGLGIVAYAFVGNARPMLTKTFTVATTSLNEEVVSNGTVQGAQDVSLSFEKGGRIAAVNAQTGDQVVKGAVIASLDNASVNAQLQAAKASLQTEQLKLQNLTSENADNGSSVQVGINNAQANLADKISDGYVKADTVLTTYTDILFNSPNSSPIFGIQVNQNNVTYTISAPDQNTLQKLDSERRSINDLMSQWKTLDQNLNSDSGLAAADAKAQQTLSAIQQLLADMSAALNVNVGQDSTFQTIQNGYKTTVATGRTTIDTAISNLKTAEQTNAMNQAPVGSYSVELQQSAVAAAQAEVNAAQASISQGLIIAPFSGTVTEQDAKVGEIASQDATLVRLISNDKYQIATYVSQTDIGKITLGMPAVVTLDAYGPSQTWNANVVTIDQTETTQNSVNAYKVTLQFNDADPQIKSGMSGAVHFEIAKKDSVLAIPNAAIIQGDNGASVLLDTGTGTESRQVTTGITGSNGYTEIISGLEAGDKVIMFGSTNSK